MHAMNHTRPRFPRFRLQSRRLQRWSIGLLLLTMVMIVPMAFTRPNAAQDAVAPSIPLTQPEPVNRFGLSQPRPRAEGAIRLATYNILNFFDHVDDPALSGEWDDKNLGVAHERALKLAEAIRAVDADIIALQEVESYEALKWFRDTYLPDMGYRYLASFDVGYFRGIECSVMSRFEITAAKVWPEMTLDTGPRAELGFAAVPRLDEPLKFQRSPLMVDIRLPDGYELTVFSLHHKAGGANMAYHREAEALRIIELIREREALEPARNIVVMGDFNAAPWDKSFRLYLEAGLVDTLQHRIIPRSREQDQAESMLHKTHESNRVLDYILLNPAAYREFVIGSAFVYGTLTPPSSYNWQRDPHPPGYASDHYPVVIDMIPQDRK